MDTQYRSYLKFRIQIQSKRNLNHNLYMSLGHNLNPIHNSDSVSEYTDKI